MWVGASGLHARKPIGRSILDSRNGLVLQNTHHYPAVLGLPVRSVVVSNLVGLSHGTGRQHSCEGNMALLDQDIRYLVGPILTELLV